MFHLLFIFFQVSFLFTLGTSYTFEMYILWAFSLHLVKENLQYFILFLGFFITFSQGWPKIIHIGDFTQIFFKLMMICCSFFMMSFYSFLDLWHQWKPHSTISPFLIDGNNHAPLVIMVHFFLSPFDINGKG